VRGTPVPGGGGVVSDIVVVRIPSGEGPPMHPVENVLVPYAGHGSQTSQFMFVMVAVD